MYFLKTYFNYDFSIQYFTEDEQKKFMKYYLILLLLYGYEIMFSFSVFFYAQLPCVTVYDNEHFQNHRKKKEISVYYNKYVENCFVQILNIYMAFHTTTLKKKNECLRVWIQGGWNVRI